MKREKLKVARELRELLSDPKFREFTILGLRKDFQLRYGLGECSNSVELRKWIYRRILSLVKKGYVIKIDVKQHGPSVYRTTERFVQDCEPASAHIEKSVQVQNAAKTPENEQINALKSKRNQYQVDMLACTGECKEYQQLVTEYPHLKSQIEPMFKSARERSSELIGQMRAINNLLKQSGLSE